MGEWLLEQLTRDEINRLWHNWVANLRYHAGATLTPKGEDPWPAQCKANQIIKDNPEVIRARDFKRLIFLFRMHLPLKNPQAFEAAAWWYLLNDFVSSVLKGKW